MSAPGDIGKYRRVAVDPSSISEISMIRHFLKCNILCSANGTLAYICNNLFSN